MSHGRKRKLGDHMSLQELHAKETGPPFGPITNILPRPIANEINANAIGASTNTTRSTSPHRHTACGPNQNCNQKVSPKKVDHQATSYRSVHKPRDYTPPLPENSIEKKLPPYIRTFLTSIPYLSEGIKKYDPYIKLDKSTYKNTDETNYRYIDERSSRNDDGRPNRKPEEKRNHTPDSIKYRNIDERPHRYIDQRCRRPSEGRIHRNNCERRYRNTDEGPDRSYYTYPEEHTYRYSNIDRSNRNIDRNNRNIDRSNRNTDRSNRNIDRSNRNIDYRTNTNPDEMCCGNAVNKPHNRSYRYAEERPRKKYGESPYDNKNYNNNRNIDDIYINIKDKANQSLTSAFGASLVVPRSYRSRSGFENVEHTPKTNCSERFYETDDNNNGPHYVQSPERSPRKCNRSNCKNLAKIPKHRSCLSKWYSEEKSWTIGSILLFLFAFMMLQKL